MGDATILRPAVLIDLANISSPPMHSIDSWLPIARGIQSLEKTTGSSAIARLFNPGAGRLLRQAELSYAASTAIVVEVLNCFDADMVAFMLRNDKDATAILGDLGRTLEPTLDLTREVRWRLKRISASRPVTASGSEIQGAESLLRALKSYVPSEGIA